MATEKAGDILAARMAELKQRQPGLAEQAKVFQTPEIEALLIKPMASSWEDLSIKLAKVINFDGVWRRARDLYDQGYGAELETFAEIAIDRADQMPPTHYFARSIGKKKGLWETRTLKTIRETWDVRRSTVEVIEKLGIKSESTKAILAIAWRLKGGITRMLALATEQGVNIKNKIGLFFYLTKKQQPATT
jgi:hypothetical protein